MKHFRLSVKDSTSIFLLFLVLTFAIYGRILWHEFIFNWDDNVYVTGNEAVRGFTWNHIKSAFSSFYVGNYAPLHIISYMIDYTLWGMNPRGYLFVGIILHTCCGFLAYRFFLALNVRHLLAFSAAVIFLVHPVQVESVAWISERKTLLSMLFSLMSLHTYLLFSRDETSKRKRWYVLSLLTLLAAMLCKSIAVVIPLIIITYDWYAGGWEGIKKGFVCKLPFFVIAGALAIITVISQQSENLIVQYLDGNPINNAMTVMPVFVRYLGLILWPAHLSPIYKPPIKTAADLEVILSFMFFAVTLSTGIYLLYRRRLAGFALTIFFFGLLPVSHIFPLPTLMQDRYLYFPLLGFSLFAVIWGTDLVVTQAGAKWRNLVSGAALFLALPLAYTAHKQAGIWRNAETLWSHATEVVPLSRQAWIMLATTRHDLKNLAGAEVAYLRLLDVAPKEKRGLNGIGILYGEKGDLERSLHYLRQAMALAPDDPEILVNFGYAAFLKGDLDQCQKSFQRAISIDSRLIAKLQPTLLEIARRQNGQNNGMARKAGGSL